MFVLLVDELGHLRQRQLNHGCKRKYCVFDLGQFLVLFVGIRLSVGPLFHGLFSLDETRSIVVRNGQAVASPSWSIHSGVGTRNYTFIWAMGGENQDFPDMDHVAMQDIL